MILSITEAVGYFGSLMLSISFFPQTYHTIKYKKYQDISILFLCLMIFTCYIMTLYGYLIQSYPVCIANIFVMINNKVILFFRIINKNKKSSHYESSPSIQDIEIIKF